MVVARCRTLACPMNAVAGAAAAVCTRSVVAEDMAAAADSTIDILVEGVRRALHNLAENICQRYRGPGPAVTATVTVARVLA